MPHTIEANTDTPALIVYLLDMSISMHQPLGRMRRVDVAAHALEFAFHRMIALSTKGSYVAPRYKIAMLAYSDHVYSLLDDVKTITEIAQFGMPTLEVMSTTDTARGFSHVEKLLTRKLSEFQQCPAPLVCHITDGEYTGEDPEPVVRRIMNMATIDGNVLVENIFISDNILTTPIGDPKQWSGILPNTPLTDDYGVKLRSMSSPLPESYRRVMLAEGYNIAPGAMMMLPGISPELVEMGFVMSTATPPAP